MARSFPICLKPPARCANRFSSVCGPPDPSRGCSSRKISPSAPASVTTLTSELIELGYLEEVAAPRDSETGRGRPAVALGVRPNAHFVAGIKLSDREHTAVIVDFAGNLLANEAISRVPHALATSDLSDAADELLTRVCAKIGLRRDELTAVGLGGSGVCGLPHGHRALVARPPRDACSAGEDCLGTGRASGACGQ